MDPAYLSLISGFVGALIGAFASVATVWIQSREQGKHAKLALIKDIAIEDHRSCMAVAEKSGGIVVPPLTAFLEYHLELAKCLENGSVGLADLERITANSIAVVDYLRTRVPTKAGSATP